MVDLAYNQESFGQVVDVIDESEFSEYNEAEAKKFLYFLQESVTILKVTH